MKSLPLGTVRLQQLSEFLLGRQLPLAQQSAASRVKPVVAKQSKGATSK